MDNEWECFVTVQVSAVYKQKLVKPRTCKTKTGKMVAVKKMGSQNREVGLLVDYSYSVN